MATQPIDRYVRVCPVHGVSVQERGTALICPKGNHAVSHFKVIDRKKGTAELVPADGNEQKGGVEAMEKTMAPAAARPGPVASPAAAKPKPREVLQRAKFQDDTGDVLWVHLIKQTTKSAGVLFLVRWTLLDAGAKYKAKTRPLAAEVYHERARTAYDEAVATAKKLGWRDVVVLHRELTFEALPKPSTTSSKRR